MDIDKQRENYYNSHFPDPQEERVYYYCDVSGDEIYEGEQYVMLSNGGICLKDDVDVLIEYLNGKRVTAGEED